MAMIRVPYNNAMRLGQGVNSFTQQLCLINAVKPSQRTKTDPHADEEAEGSEDPDPALGISQIVTYSSRFVDKVSDVMHDMNVSAALAIKTASFEGSGSGKYINTDKFKEADLNFFIQVKVTNQEHMGADYNEFNPITIEQTRFTEVYGDAFISGWEEGGEFNALLSMRVRDKSNLTHISGQIEASLGKGIVTGKADGSLDDALHGTDTETTVSVNWCGGGQLKDVNAPWDMKTMLQAACNFPELVAMTPQRKYAILTKYSMLPSFYTSAGMKFSALDYENAGIYASFLLETYTEYKSIWKELQVTCEELQAGIPGMELLKVETDDTLQKCIKDAVDAATDASKRSSHATVDTVQAALIRQANDKLAPFRLDPSKSMDQPTLDALKGLLEEYSHIGDKKPDFKPSIPDYKPYEATVLGLLDARHDCRLEMLKIVHEVDLVRQSPEISLDPDRKMTFVHPAAFRALLPIRSSNVKFFEGDIVTVPERIKHIIQVYQSRAAEYHMSSPWGKVGEVGSQDDTVGVESLGLKDAPGVAFALHVYTNKENGTIQAYNLFYTNGLVTRSASYNPDDEPYVFQWSPEQQEFVQFISIEGGTHGSRTLVDRMFVATTKKALEITATPKDAALPKNSERTTALQYAPSRQWNIGGFWDLKPKDGVGTTRLCAIWSRVDLFLAKQGTPPSLFDGDPAAIVNPQLRAILESHAALGHEFRLSPCSGDLTQNGTQTFATQIFDYRYRSMLPHKITALSKDNKSIQAITTAYSIYYRSAMRDHCTIPTGHARVDVGDTGPEQFDYPTNIIDTIKIGVQKTTPARIRYIKFSEKTKDTLVPPGADTSGVTEMVVSQPAAVDDRIWLFSGFYGAADSDGLLSLGVVWQRRSDPKMKM